MPFAQNRHMFEIEIYSQSMEVRTMPSVCKLLLPLAAAVALAIPGVSLACDYHGASASLSTPQSVAEQPAPTPPAAPPGNSG